MSRRPLEIHIWGPDLIYNSDDAKYEYLQLIRQIGSYNTLGI